MVDVGFAVRANGLGMRYRRNWALRDCSFELAPGTVTALVGANDPVRRVPGRVWAKPARDRSGVDLGSTHAVHLPAVRR